MILYIVDIRERNEQTMRKFLLGAVLAAVCAMGMTAMASDITGTYKPGINSYDASITDSAKTIIIYKGKGTESIKGENIYYIDQVANDTGFAGNINALMKSGATAGIYTVSVNGGKFTTFEISEGAAAVEGDTPVTQKETGNNANGVYSAAYIIEGITNFSSINSVKFLLNDGTVEKIVSVDKEYVWGSSDNYPTIDTNTPVTCAVQIDDIPDVGSAQMFLSTDTVASN